MMFLGAAIASGSVLAFVFAAVFALLVHVGITKIEEPHLEQVFDLPFLEYKQRVGRYFTAK
jgi:protein-S-isoprenylcysteine O-methyltransferase Ste14